MRPVLWAENRLAYEAFWELSPERPSGFGEAFIPRSVIREFAQDEQVDFEDLFWKVRSLDAAYLKHQREKAERERELEQRRSERNSRAKPRRR